MCMLDGQVALLPDPRADEIHPLHELIQPIKLSRSLSDENCKIYSAAAFTAFALRQALLNRSGSIDTHSFYQDPGRSPNVADSVIQ